MAKHETEGEVRWGKGHMWCTTAHVCYMDGSAWKMISGEHRWVTPCTKMCGYILNIF
jgi:hypothetical protein